jgi:predicted nucleic acid-binding protein
MTFKDLNDGESVFLDANILVYHFAPHPVFGPPSQEFIRRVETQAIIGYTSTAVLSETAHHLMSFEASVHFGWTSKVVQRLRNDPAAVQQLDKFQRAIAQVPRLGIHILTIPESLVETAAGLSKQTGLLSNDALVVAVMQAHSLIHLASHDADFDRVPGIARYGPA